MEQVWVLASGVVAPNGHLLHRSYGLIQLLGNLGNRTIVVKAGHGRELTWINALCITHRNERVCVGRIAYNQNLDVLFRRAGNRLALGFEDSTVGAQKIGALHAVLAWHCSDQKRYIGITECNVRVITHLDTCKQRKCAVIEFHLHSTESA